MNPGIKLPDLQCLVSPRSCSVVCVVSDCDRSFPAFVQRYGSLQLDLRSSAGNCVRERYNAGYYSTAHSLDTDETRGWHPLAITVSTVGCCPSAIIAEDSIRREARTRPEEVATSFMQDGTYSPRNFATLGTLQPPFGNRFSVY